MPDLLEKYIKHIGVICIALLFSLVVVQVVLRYGFGYTHFLTEELGRYLLVWGTLAGMVIETRRGGHIRVAFLVDKIPLSIRRIWLLFLDIITLLMFLVLVYTGTGSTIFNHGQESSGLQIPLSIPFSAIPLFFALAAVFLAWKLWQQRGTES